jgi:hypothetical protein
MNLLAAEYVIHLPMWWIAVPLVIVASIALPVVWILRRKR